MPDTLHLDRRANLLATIGAVGDDDDLLTTPQLAEWLAVSEQWCEIGRHKGYGPPYVKLAGRVRYRRCAVRAWLNERAHRSTSEYRGPRATRRIQSDRSKPQPEVRVLLRRRS